LKVYLEDPDNTKEPLDALETLCSGDEEDQEAIIERLQDKQVFDLPGDGVELIQQVAENHGTRSYGR